MHPGGNRPHHPIHHGKDVSPGAPIDIEHGLWIIEILLLDHYDFIIYFIFVGPEPPCFDDSDSDSEADDLVGPGHCDVVHPNSAPSYDSSAAYSSDSSSSPDHSVTLRVTSASTSNESNSEKESDEPEKP